MTYQSDVLHQGVKFCQSPIGDDLQYSYLSSYTTYYYTFQHILALQIYTFQLKSVHKLYTFQISTNSLFMISLNVIQFGRFAPTLSRRARGKDSKTHVLTIPLRRDCLNTLVKIYFYSWRQRTERPLARMLSFARSTPPLK